jgi:pimeloyl-ACP methyl ester carboxylesterase
MHQLELAGGRTLQVAEGGDPDGVLLVVHHGAPGGAVLEASWDRDATARGLHLVTYARPGYGASTRHLGRSVADAAYDVAALADAYRADRFLTWGSSGGGPHALACAALLPDRVVAAASLAGVGPWDGAGLDWLAGMGEGNIEEFGTVAEHGEQGARPLLGGYRDSFLAASRAEIVEAMSPFLSDVDAAELRGPLGGWLVEMLHGGLAGGVDGWVDDDLVFTRPWGFSLTDIRVPVLVRQGRLDAMVPYAHGEWLGRHVPGADVRLTEDDGHLTLLSRGIADAHGWLRDRWDAAASPTGPDAGRP